MKAVPQQLAAGEEHARINQSVKELRPDSAGQAKADPHAQRHKGQQHEGGGHVAHVQQAQQAMMAAQQAQQQAMLAAQQQMPQLPDQRRSIPGSALPQQQVRSTITGG